MKIGIFTAMDKEAKTFLQNATKTMDGSFAIYTFKLGKHDGILCCPANIGEIAAAASCQLLISKYKVDVIMNFGVVGALTKDVSKLSTMLVESVVHYAMDVTQIDDVPLGTYSYFGDAIIPTDKTLLQKAQRVANLPTVRCASADKFVDDAKEKQYLNQNFGAHICDMESAGILITCKFNNVPCLMIKCVSDSLFGGHAEYRITAEQAANGFFELATRIADTF